MARDSIRISLVLNDNKQYKRWKNFQISNGYGNFSQMVRCLVEEGIKRKNDPIEKSIEPLKDALDGLYKLVERINDCLEIIRMRLADKEGNSEIIKAARKILPFILQREKSLSEINGKFSDYDKDVIDGAMALLIDLELIGTRKSSSKKEKIWRRKR